jgi:hypothetical protein
MAVVANRFTATSSKVTNQYIYLSVRAERHADGDADENFKLQHLNAGTLSMANGT